MTEKEREKREGSRGCRSTGIKWPKGFKGRDGAKAFILAVADKLAKRPS